MCFVMGLGVGGMLPIMFTIMAETIPARQFIVRPDSTVDLVLRRTTTTLVAHRIGPLKQFDVISVHAVGTPPTL